MRSRTRALLAIAIAAAIVMVISVIYAIHIRPVCKNAEYILNSTEKVLSYENKIVKEFNITHGQVLKYLNESNSLLERSKELIRENKCNEALRHAIHSLIIAERVYRYVTKIGLEKQLLKKMFARALSLALAHIYAKYMKNLGINNKTLLVKLKRIYNYCVEECNNLSNIRKTFDCVIECYDKNMKMNNMIKLVYWYDIYKHVKGIVTRYLKVINNTKIIEIVPPSYLNGVCRPGIIYLKIGKNIIKETFNCSRKGVEEFVNCTRRILRRVRRIERRVRALYIILPMLIHNKDLVNKLEKDLRVIIERSYEIESSLLRFVHSHRREGRHGRIGGSSVSRHVKSVRR